MYRGEEEVLGFFKARNWDIMTQDTLLRGEGWSCEDTSVTRKF